MCGIVGYVGQRDAAPVLLDGLKRLEYRGYDSAGIAVIGDGQVRLHRAVGKLANLEALFQASPLAGSIGMGHTRWATHGRPSEENSHPHRDCRGEIVVIHNGIVENYLELKRDLQLKGHTFSSQTDTEVIPHLIEEELNGAGDDVSTYDRAIRNALSAIRGAHAIVVLSTRWPDRLVAARLGNAGGVTIGLGEGENYVASDMPAILPYTRRMIFLQSGDVATITRSAVAVAGLDGAPATRSPQTVNLDPVSAAKGGYKHFMLKEIHEQARSVAESLAGRLDPEGGNVYLEDVHLTPQQAQQIRRILIVACGTAWHAALVGKFLIEDMAGLPVEVDYASEFRYRSPLVDKDTLLVAVTQSGETVDTLTAMEQARQMGARVLAVVNVVGSQAGRIADDVIYMHTGLEIGVAASKTFTSQMICLYMLGLALGRLRGVLAVARARALVADLGTLPQLVGRALALANPYLELANRFHAKRDFLYLGRGINYPIALEGALKLKEISYIHAEGYPAGEMKHGPIALIAEDMPVVSIAVRDHVYDKMISNIEQVIARSGTVIAVANEGDTAITEKAQHVLYVPAAPPLLTPILTVIPLQLLAYHIADRRGCDVDQPRNLAKSVTVE
jgi:glucosamine--fructose-6-phosphate aminotransferase (isomerizing)